MAFDAGPRAIASEARDTAPPLRIREGEQAEAEVLMQRRRREVLLAIVFTSTEAVRFVMAVIRHLAMATWIDLARDARLSMI